MSRANRVFKLGGCLIKCLVSLVIASICAFLLWRIFSSGDPKTMSTLSVNENIHTAYQRDGEGPRRINIDNIFNCFIRFPLLFICIFIKSYLY